MIQTTSAASADPSPGHREVTHAVEQQIRKCLHESSYRCLRSVECSCCSGQVQLTGSLPSFFMKQMAQEIVLRVDAVTAIHNQIEVIEVKESMPSSEKIAGFGYADRLALLGISPLPVHSSNQRGVVANGIDPVLEVQNDRNEQRTN